MRYTITVELEAHPGLGPEPSKLNVFTVGNQVVEKLLTQANSNTDKRPWFSEVSIKEIAIDKD